MSLYIMSTSDLILKVFVDSIPILPKFSNRIRRIEVESQVNLPSSCEIEFTDPDLTIPMECGLEIGNFVEVRAVTGDDAAGDAVVFGQVIARQLVIFQTCGPEMKIIQNRIFDSRIDNVFGKA